jgi:FHA domain
MKILDKAVRLEKALLSRMVRRTDIARHPIEVYGAILDDCEDATEAGARGSRIFPYHAISVRVATSGPHARATAEAVFSEAPALEQRVRMRLRSAGCADVGDVTVTLEFVDGTSAEWAGREYSIDFSREAGGRARKPEAAGEQGHELHLSVIGGKAAKTRYSLATPRINLGRLNDVVDQQQRIIRQNHVVFSDADDEASQSVSRAHAHIRFDVSSGEARLHDDGSTHGTRVVRASRTIHVPRGGRGIALRNLDEVVLGQARLRVEVRRAKRIP